MSPSGVKNGPKADVRVESDLPPITDVGRAPRHVAFVPGTDSCTAANVRGCAAYSITSSARASSDGGTSRPSIIAVAKLMTSSNLLACTTGKSAGLAPLRMRPA